MPDANGPPDVGQSPDTEEAEWELATADSLKARGEFATAAEWYRRAAEHLMEAGDDDRALQAAKSAAEAAQRLGPPAAKPSMLPPGGASLVAAAGGASASAAASAPPASTAPASAARAPTPAPVPRAATAPRPAAAPSAPPPPPPEALRRPVSAAPPAAAPSAPPPSTAPARLASVARAPTPAPIQPASTPATPVLGSSAPRPSTSPAPIGPGPRAVLSRAAPTRAPSLATQPPGPSQAMLGRRSSPPGAPTVIPSAASTPAPALMPSAEPGARSTLAGHPIAPSAAPAPIESTTGREPGRAFAFDATRVAEMETILARIPTFELFAEVPAGRLVELARQIRLARFRAGEAVVEDGEPALYLVVDGTLTARLDGEDGPPVRATAGQAVGALAAYFGSPRTVSPTAQTDATALALPAPLVRGLAREFAPLRERLVAQCRARAFANVPRVSPLFRTLGMTARASLYAAFAQLALPEDALVLLDGQNPEGVYLVAAGTLEVYGGGLGSSRTRIAGVGDLVGVTAVLAGEPAGVCARARGPVLLAHLPRAAFFDVAREHAHLLGLLSDVGVPGRGVVC